MCRIILILSITIFVSCVYHSTKDENVGMEDLVEESLPPQSSWFVKSTDPADSVWIGVLNRIPLPPTIDQDSLINVYFKYKQPIKGYEVTARWMLSNAHSWDGYIVMNFRNTNSGASFHVSSDEYANFNTDEVAHADNFKGYYDGDVYYFEYPSKEEWQDSLYLLGYTPPPFRFLDVDFDGKDELLISEWENYLPNNYHQVYKIRGNTLIEQDYVPLNRLSHNFQIDTVRQIIVLREHNGPDDIAELYFSKANAPILKIEPPQLKTWSGQSIVEEYARLSCHRFSLDSIYSYHNDSLYKYLNISIASNERLRGRLREYEKISQIFDKYYDPSWDFPGDYTIGIADFPTPESSKRLVLRYKTLFAKEAETWAELMDKSFRRWLSKEIKVKDYSVANYWQEMKLIRAASLRDFYMSLCNEDFIPDRDYDPIDTAEINRLSSVEEYQNTTEQKRWIAWFKSRERISPFLPPKLRKVWDNCTYKACHLRLKQLTIRHMQADSTKQVQKRN